MDIRSVIYGVVFSFIWSSAFTSAAYIVADAPPFFALALRFFIGAILAICVAYALGQRFEISGAQFKLIALFGLLQNTVYLGLNFVALQWIEASLAVVIAASMPLWAASFAAIFKGERLAPRGVLGLLLGFGGMILVMYWRLSEGADIVGVGLCVLAVIGLTLATMLVPNASGGKNLLMVVGLQSLIGSAGLLILALVTETLVVNLTQNLVISFIYTTIFPGLVAVVIWFALINRIGTTRASAFHFLNPFFGVLIAALVLSEALRMVDFIGVGIIMIGILAVQTARIKT